MRDRGVELAIRQAGSASSLARLLGVTPAAVLQWKKVPVERVPDVERATGVPRHILRPEFWPEPRSA
jgi:DNA-binding transcriptional regulator YdaS (Cro superfamily)